ncbi:threonine/serine exporter family protein [Tumebacillus sp. ITR2]|uniref:Threonine/serine exporter family protein n=1 Tax=Tumebacillus amylolyticus TaxID=2801339 RepID=A0ABS1J543_9BACL|nr:threonine/serine exporter family protein [Tumebacillus amylolyticus]MBL0385376.1 threonine/serine exporter family protein [Tumebacillus amylolyticus]
MSFPYTMEQIPHLLLLLVMSWLATLGYAILYHVPKSASLWVGLIGTAAWLSQDLAMRFGVSSVGAAFVGGLVVSVLSEYLARLKRMPVIVFVVGGIVPLVPGSSAFRTMREFVTGHQLQGLAQGTNTFLIASAISAGLVIAGTIMRLDRRRRYENPSTDRERTPDGN